MLRALLLLLFALPAWAYPPGATADITDASIDACDYEDTTTGETARVPVIVDMERGQAAYAYRVCRFELLHWPAGASRIVRMRSVRTSDGALSEWTAATIDKPAAAQVTLALVGGAQIPDPPPPDPQPMPSDTFTNSNGTSLASHNASWVVPTSGTGLRIWGGTVVSIGNTTSTNNVNYWNTTVADAHYSKCTLSTSQNSASGPAVRVQSGNPNHYYASYFGGSVYAGQFVSGSRTDWDSGVSGWVAGDVVELSIDPVTPTTVYLKRNGTTVATYTSKSALSGGRYGVQSFDDANTTGCTDWEGGDVGGGSASILPQMMAHHH